MVLLVFNKLFLRLLFAEKTFNITDEIPVGRTSIKYKNTYDIFAH